MYAELPDVPPVVPLLIFEVYAKSGDYDESRKRLKALLPELKAQSEVYRIESVGRYGSAKATGMDVYLDGGLNLFTGNGACQAWTCRQQQANRIARSIGLIADTIWVTDYFTDRFCNFGRVTNRKLDAVMSDMLVLAELLPLIVAGIVKFRTPWVPSCAGCMQYFEDQVDAITEGLTHDYASEFSFETQADGVYSFHTGTAYEPPLKLMLVPRTKEGVKPLAKNEHIHDFVYNAVRSALWTGRDAALGRGAVFSNSKIGLAGLALQEGTVRNRSELQLLDDSRSIIMPWVSDLSPAQIVQLRGEAAKALPMLRALLARHLSEGGEGSSTKNMINDLRAQAVEVRNELENTQKYSMKYWKTAYVTLGFGLSAYGVATEQVLPAVGGLLPLLTLLMTHKAGTEKDIDKLERKPGYVLVKAQDLLAHDH